MIRCSTRLPVLLLVLQMLAVGAGLFAVGKLTPRVEPDTATYEKAPLDSPTRMLTNFRMPVYPLFLAAARRLSSSYATVPLLHFVLYCGGVGVFYLGLRAAELGGWSSSLVAGALLYSNSLHASVQPVISDVLAATWGVVTVGLVMLSVGRGQRWWRLLLVGAAATLAWLTRPAYLFLVPLVPLLGSVLTLRATGLADAAARRSEMLRCVRRLGTVVLVPLAAWCLLRWGAVGSAAVTSTTGSYLIGIVGQFLDPSLVEDLPSDVRPLASAALKRSEELPPGTLVMTDAPPLSYMRIEKNYDATLEIFHVAARELAGRDQQIEPKLRSLAWGIVARRPGAYALWLVKAFGQGLSQVAANLFLNPWTLALAGITALASLSAVLRRWRTGRAAVAAAGEGAAPLLFVIAMLYLGLSLANIVVVAPPLGRFTHGSGIFLPPLLMAVLVEQVSGLPRRPGF